MYFQRILFVNIDFSKNFSLYYSLIILYSNNFFLGPPSIPIVGQGYLTLKRTPEAIVEHGVKLYKIYGNVIGGYLGTKVVAFLVNPQDTEKILSSSVHIEKADDYQ